MPWNRKFVAIIAAAAWVVALGPASRAQEPATAEDHLDRAASRAAGGDHDAAAADFTAAIRLDPKCARAYMGRGQCHRQLGRLDKAAADFAEAVRMAPKDPDARASRGECLRMQGK